MKPHRFRPLWAAVCVTWLGRAGGEPDASSPVGMQEPQEGGGTWMGEPFSTTP